MSGLNRLPVKRDNFISERSIIAKVTFRKEIVSFSRIIFLPVRIGTALFSIKLSSKKRAPGKNSLDPDSPPQLFV